jgi:hypothetical protein
MLTSDQVLDWYLASIDLDWSLQIIVEILSW